MENHLYRKTNMLCVYINKQPLSNFEVHEIFWLLLTLDLYSISITVDIHSIYTIIPFSTIEDVSKYLSKLLEHNDY